jgi:hypothetical protein
MKIHFRRVDGERTMFLELTDGAFCGFQSQEYRADLPGEPLKYGDMNATLLKTLREKHFLDDGLHGRADADMGATWGTLTLRLPDPVTLLKATRPGDWKQARDRVKHKAAGLEEFQAFARWWEYLRRSEAYRRDCETIRGGLAEDVGLIWAAFTGAIEKPFFLYSIAKGTCPGEFDFLPRTSEIFWKLLRKTWLKTLRFSKLWGLPQLGHLPFLWPELTTAEDLIAAFFAADVTWETLLPCLPSPSWGAEKKSNAETWRFRSSEKLGTFYISCNQETAFLIANALFQARLPIKTFRFVDNIFQLWKDGPKQGVIFSIEDGTPKTWDKAFAVISRFVHVDFLQMRTWDKRRCLKLRTLRRELAAFDGRTDLDAELWPGLAGDSLKNSKSTARTKARKRISAIENAAEERRRTLSPTD